MPNPDDDFAKAILADCEAFEAKCREAQVKTCQSAQDAVAKLEAANVEMQKALAQPARG